MRRKRMAAMAAMAAAVVLGTLLAMASTGCGRRIPAEGEEPPPGMRGPDGKFRLPATPAQPRGAAGGQFRQPGPPTMGGAPAPPRTGR